MTSQLRSNNNSEDQFAKKATGLSQAQNIYATIKLKGSCQETSRKAQVKPLSHFALHSGMIGQRLT